MTEILSANEFDTHKLAAAVEAHVTHKPGAVKLDGFPLLVYAPVQHGDGIRTEDVGATVHDICAKLVELPDLDQVAAHFRTTAEHVRQAAAYALAHIPPAETE